MSSKGSVVAARRAIALSVADAADVDVSWADGWEENEGWPLAADALRFLTALVRALEPDHVLELGSGLSTVALARERQRREGQSTLTVLEHDPVFTARTRQALAAAGVADGVDLRLTHLVARRCRGRFLPVYSLDGSGLASVPRAELVLVDGPPGPLGGREGALYQALERSRRGTVLLLDDAKRPEESALLDTLEAELAPAVEVTRLDELAKGMGCVVVTDPDPLERLTSMHALTATDSPATPGDST